MVFDSMSLDTFLICNTASYFMPPRCLISAEYPGSALLGAPINKEKISIFPRKKHILGIKIWSLEFYKLQTWFNWYFCLCNFVLDDPFVVLFSGLRKNFHFYRKISWSTNLQVFNSNFFLW